MSSTDAFETAQQFLAPLSSRRGKSAKGQTSLIDVLGPESQDEDQKRRSVVSEALQHLQRIHEQLLTSAGSTSAEPEMIDPRHSKAINMLLDLVILEGMYPFFSPGVGVPIDKRLKSAVPTDGSVQVSTALVTRPDRALLNQSVKLLLGIAKDKPSGLAPTVWDRCFVDLVSGVGELTFNPSTVSRQQHNWVWLWQEAETSTILKLVSAFKLADVPIWLRSEMTKQLSTLPLRPRGVEQILSHFAFSQEPLPGEDEPSGKTQQPVPTLALNGLLQGARLLRAVPTSMSTEEYFKQISPQLLDLLDGRQGADLQAAAGFAITNILAQRTLGAPGTPGWKLFTLPILESIKQNGSNEVNTRGLSIQIAIGRLKALFVVNVNEGVARRLIGPVLLNLWNLLVTKASCSDDITSIIRTFLAASDTTQGVERLVQAMSGVSSGSTSLGTGFEDISLERLTTLDRKISVLSDLLSSDSIPDESVAAVFFDRCKSVLGEKGADGQDLLVKLVNTKLAEAMLEKYGSRIVEHPGKIIELCSNALSSTIENNVPQQQKPSIESLSSIASPEQAGDQNWDNAETAISLLASVLALDDVLYTQENLQQLETLQTRLVPALSRRDSLDTGIQLSFRNLANLIEVTLAQQSVKAKQDDPYRQDTETYQAAMKAILSNKDPSSRGQAVQSISSLVSSRSPVLDVQSTLVTLISLLQENEEFVYVNVIKALSTFAKVHSKTTVALLMESYVDEKEDKSLDLRLRVGEALLQAVQELGAALVDEAVNLIGHGMLAVASRRAEKYEKARKMQQNSEEQRKQHKEAEDAWGGDIPDIEDADGDSAVKQAILENIVEGWSGREAKDEDIRVRTSAVSILGSAIETNIAGVGSRVCSEALDMSLSILALETRPSDIILRRAAARLVLSVLGALQGAAAAGTKLAFELDQSSIEDAVRVLSFVADTDSDHIVKGHAMTVVDRLRSHRSDIILLSQENVQSTELHTVAGLPPLDPRNGRSGSHPRIEEID